MAKSRKHVDDLRSVSRLAIEATKGLTGLIEAMHSSIAAGPDLIGRPLERPAKLVTGALYGAVQGVANIVGSGVDRALIQLAPLLGESVPGPEREAILSALNGVLGDYLFETNNSLAIEMSLRCSGHSLLLDQKALRQALPTAGNKLVVLVHGLCMNDLQWHRRGHDHGSALARDLGYTPAYLHYNTGLHISTNGRNLASLLEQLVSIWPAKLEELVLIGHSMGGLVARSACHIGESAEHIWRKRLRKLFCLASPHHGASLERAGSWVDMLLGASRYSAPLAQLGKIRSAGITDLRFGNVLDEDWLGRDRFAIPSDSRKPVPLPEHVACYALAATLAPTIGIRRADDGLVGLESALGRHIRPELTLAFPLENQWIGSEMGHLDLLNRPEAYETLRRWCADAQRTSR